MIFIHNISLYLQYSDIYACKYNKKKWDLQAIRRLFSILHLFFQKNPGHLNNSYCCLVILLNDQTTKQQDYFYSLMFVVVLSYRQTELLNSYAVQFENPFWTGHPN